MTLSRYGGHERALVALTVVCNAAVAVAITFMVLIAEKKVLTRRVGGQGLTHTIAALGHTSTAVQTRSHGVSASTTIASFLVGAYFAEPDWSWT